MMTVIHEADLPYFKPIQLLEVIFKKKSYFFIFIIIVKNKLKNVF
jgi:hypothetical protein